MMTNDQIAEAVDAALKYALELSEEEDGWKVEKEQGEAVVKTKKNKDGRKVWLCTATVNVGPKLLFDKMKVIETVVTRTLFSCFPRKDVVTSIVYPKLHVLLFSLLRTWIMLQVGIQL